MNIIKKYWLLLIILILFCIIECFIPLNISSLYFHNLDINYYINNFLSITKGNLLSELIIIITSKFKFIRVIFYSIISLYLFIYMMKIVSKNNINFTFIGMFLFFLIDHDILKGSFYSIDGFIYNILSCLFLLIILYLISSSKIDSTNKFKIFLLGLFGSLISPIYTIFISVISILYILKSLYLKKDFTRYFVLFSGSLLASFIFVLLHFMNNKFYDIPNYLLNFIEYTIPSIYRNNFLLSLIMIVILFYLGFKIYNRDLNKRIYIIICFISITIYSLIYLLEFNIYFKYFSFITYIASSYYILQSFNHSITFKRKINIYYLFKVLYLLIINLFSNLNISYLIFIYITDILIILECVYYLFPKDFMKRTWLIFSILMIIGNIYLTFDSFNKFNEMNSYIFNNLECNNYIIDLPYKYKLIRFDNYIPYTNLEKQNYLKYHNINVGNDFCIKDKSID